MGAICDAATEQTNQSDSAKLLNTSNTVLGPGVETRSKAEPAGFLIRTDMEPKKTK